MSKFAYIDESGTFDLEIEKAATSNYFIVTAILVDEVDNEKFLEEVEKLRQKHFQSSEIKSSSIKAKDNHKRRKRILKDVSGIDFKFYTLVIDKSAIHRDSPLGFKKTFIKNINGKIYSSLFQTFSEISVIADEHGSESFVESLQSYVDKNHIPDLFKSSKFILVKSVENLGVQLADLIAGTISQVYEGRADDELEEVYKSLVKEKSLGIDEWPRKYTFSQVPQSHDSSLDTKIKNFAEERALLYLENNNNRSDFDTKLKVSTLRYLLFRHQWMDPDSYIATEAIIEHLQYSDYGSISAQIIRTTIIAKLRDEGVLIASSNSGYKIPSKLSDMYDFAARVDSQVVPLLKRLKMAKTFIYKASMGEVDILKNDNFNILSRLIDELDEFS